MAGSATVSIFALPTLFTVSGGGIYCAGGAGADVSLLGSVPGVNYQLYNGGTAEGSPLAGTGSPVDFGPQAAAGTYTVVAKDTATMCTSNMTGSVSVSINPSPALYTLSGGGDYCAGGTGVNIGLSNTDSGINYQLYLSGTVVSSYTCSTSGGCGSHTFGPETVAGTYTIVATNLGTACTVNMPGSETVNINPLPVIQTLSGTGSYCAGGTGVHLFLSGSQTGVNYQLFIGALPEGTTAGTGVGTLDLGAQTTGGTYTAVATTAAGCSSNMTGTATVSISPLPTSTYAVSGGGSYCAGGSGVSVSLTGSDLGIDYQLFNSGSVVGTSTAGTGGVLPFGPETGAGTYTVVATNPISHCTANMTGSVTVVINPLPVVGAISGSATVCAGATITLSGTPLGGVWTSSVPGFASVIASSGVVSGASAGSTTITYTVTSLAGCSAYSVKTETVIASPVVDIITGATNVCITGTLDLSDATSGGVWSSSNTSEATVGSTGIVTGVASGSPVISYRVTNASGCSASVLFPISVGAPLPTSVVLPAAATLCNGTPVNLRVSSVASSGLTYQWSVDGALITGATDSTYTADTAGLYTATISNGTCSLLLTATNIVPPPAPIITLDTPTNLLFTGSFVSYEWLLDSTAIPFATLNNVPDTAAPGSAYRVVVTDANGCADTSAPFIVPFNTSEVATVNMGSNISIYPNPATSVLYINAPVKVYVSILSPDGQVLVNRKQAVSLNISEIPDGLYMIMVYDENNMLLKADKFVKTQ